MPAFAIRRKEDHQFLGVISSPVNDLFNRIDEEVDPYGVEFCCTRLNQRHTQWCRFRFINMEYAEIEPACEEDSYLEAK